MSTSSTTPTATDGPTPSPAREGDRTGVVRRVAFVSLGCPKNLVDSEAMLATLSSAGFELVSDHDRADAVVVNTCGFLEASKEESLEVIREALDRKRSGRLARVVVAGCLVQRHRAKLLEWAPGIDAMIGVFDRDHVTEAVAGPATMAERPSLEQASDGPRYWIAGNALQAADARGRSTVGLTVHGADGKGLGYWEDDGPRLRLTPRHWAYLRVSEGCNQRCAFCTIPSIRGKMRSKPLATIEAEARALMADGAFELNLIGQDTTSYGRDIGEAGGLVAMLETLDRVAAEHGGGWMRLMYAYPTDFTDAMIDAIARLPNVVKYVDIPLQHASDAMLERMRRRTTHAEQLALLTKLRERIPGMAIRTTFITGHPGETDEDHERLMDFIDQVQFDMLGVFRYSPEPGTPSGTMDADPALHVPDEVKVEREAELMLLQQEIAFDNAAYVAEQDSVFDVLIDGPAPEVSAAAARDVTAEIAAGKDHAPVTEGATAMVGRCYHQAPQVDSSTCVVSHAPLTPGELVRCQVVAADGYDLFARPLEELPKRVSLPVI